MKKNKIVKKNFTPEAFTALIPKSIKGYDIYPKMEKKLDGNFYHELYIGKLKATSFFWDSMKMEKNFFNVVSFLPPVNAKLLGQFKTKKECIQASLKAIDSFITLLKTKP